MSRFSPPFHLEQDFSQVRETKSRSELEGTQIQFGVAYLWMCIYIYMSLYYDDIAVSQKPVLDWCLGFCARLEYNVK